MGRACWLQHLCLRLRLRLRHRILDSFRFLLKLLPPCPALVQQRLLPPPGFLQVPQRLFLSPGFLLSRSEQLFLLLTAPAAPASPPAAPVAVGAGAGDGAMISCARSLEISSLSCRISARLGSSLSAGRVRTFFAASAYRSVDAVSW